MEINGIGMACNIFTPLFLLAKGVSPQFLHAFLIALACHVILSVLVFRMRTKYCIALVPTYMTSLMFAWTLRSNEAIAVSVTLSVLLAIYKVGVCMSVCLHRYASHAAFKCSDTTRFFVSIMCCAANQGGPIWWASQHRCHHKHCDLPRDPHAAIQVGTERAFSFFLEHVNVIEEFCPKHCDSWVLRILDTWSYLVVSVEMALAYHYFGREGLFVSYTSAWICQCIALWFNVANHPEDVDAICKASDVRAKPSAWYPAFWFLEMLYPVFATVVGEGNHQVHHDQFALAKRGPYDLAYYVSIAPLASLGLVWDVKGVSKQL